MKYLLMYNPTSGKGKFYKKLPKIIKIFTEANLNLDIYRSLKPYDLEAKVVNDGSKYDVIIISGGDGSINEVINGLMQLDKRPKLAIMPSGTANDIAAILGINKNIKRTLNILFENKPVKIDVNKVNDRYFLYTTAAGILTKISYDTKRSSIKRLGYLAYLFAGAKDLMKNYRMKMEITHDDGVVSGEFMLVLGLSAKRVGGIKFRNFSEAKLNDGKLELRLIRHVKRFRLFRLISFAVKGGRKHKTDVNLKSSYFKIKSSEDVVWNTDGEKGVNGEVVIEVKKEAIEIFASKKAIKEYF